MPETPDHAQIDSGVATSLDQSTESHLETLQRAAIGPINADYYLPLLARFEADGRASPSWNWAACVNTLNWMVFRGLWIPALLYGAAVAGAALCVLSAIALAAPMTASLQWSLWAALATLALLIPGFFGNVWLHGVYRQRLEKALTATPNLKDASMLLARWSSSRQRMVAIAVGNLVLAGLIVAWVWPSDLHMRMWPRVSGNVEDMAPPPSMAASVPVAASDSVLESAPPPETATGSTLQARPNPSEPADPPSSAAGRSSSDAVSGASSEQTAAKSAAFASVSTDSAVSAKPASAADAADAPTAIPVAARASAPADSASAPAAVTAAVVAPASTAKASETAASTAVSAGSAPALSVAPGAATSAPQPAIGASDAQAQSPQPTDTLLQPLGPSARAAAKQNAAIAAYARAARSRLVSIAEPQTKTQPPPPPGAEAPKRAKTPVAAATKVTSPSGDFVINVGLFAQQDNARRTHARLEKAGLPAISDTLQMRSGERTRVRVGPFTTQAQADAAAKRVRDLQLDAIVVQR